MQGKTTIGPVPDNRPIEPFPHELTDVSTTRSPTKLVGDMNAGKLRESCNIEYVVLDLLERSPAHAIDWARGVRRLFNEARRLVRDGADPTGLPEEPPRVTNVHEARRLVDGIVKWAVASDSASGPDDTCWPIQATVARQLSVCRSQVQRMIQREELRTNGKTGRDCRIDPASIIEVCERKGLRLQDNDL